MWLAERVPMQTWVGVACWVVAAASSVACSGGSSNGDEAADPPRGGSASVVVDSHAGSPSATVHDGEGGTAAPTAECGERLSLGQIGAVSSGLGSPTTAATLSYVGAAIVERSSEQKLLLAYDGADGDAEPRHIEVSASEARPLPVLPGGVQVWLSVTEVFRNLQGLAPGTAMAISTEEQGPLLLGYAWDTTTPGLPSAKRVEQSGCTVHENPTCPGDASSYVTYMAAELQGDEEVVIDDSKIGTLQLAGLAYDAVVTAREDIARCGVNDYFPPRVTFELRAQNVDALIAGLTMR